MRYIPTFTKFKDWESKTNQFKEKTFPMPAIVVPIENYLDEVVGVQRIYLDPETGKKPSKKHKFSKGDMRGNVGIIHRGKLASETLVIAEGPETAASVIDAINAIENKIPVLASLSLGNYVTLGDIIAKHWKPKKVVLAADNDAEENVESILKFKDSLERSGLKLDVRRPKMLEDEEKTDWNDILKVFGPEELKRQFMSNR